MRKTALIVDDSRSARVVLKRMLETHSLDVDTAESAEDALDYLNDHRPDVIFMDHLMPGMDGFEAVTAIKNNPDTATIPIMMYTSQEGELYVGQARALGAVGVLPKKVEPVEVSKVLQSLRVIGREPSLPGEVGESDAAGTSGTYPGLETLDKDLRILIRDLFDQQRNVLRSDLLDNYKIIAARAADEVRQKDARDIAAPSEPTTAKSADTLRGYRVALLVVAFFALLFASLYLKRERDWQESRQLNAALQQDLATAQADGAADTLQLRREVSDQRQSLASMYTAALNGLEWGANQAAHYAFGEIPLGDARLAVLESLTEQLAAIGFAGVIRIETHVADFCVLVGGAEGIVLAPDYVDAVACDRIGLAAGEAYENGLRQSVTFANYVRLARERFAGRIRYEITSMGNSDPLVDYPAAMPGITAGQWNRLAAANNRVVISLYPDGQ